jgi:hypothetical protein
VSAVACEAGIRYPVALTAAVWACCVAVPPGVECQEEAGRLCDVVWMLRCAVRRAQGSVIAFALHLRNDNRAGTPPLVHPKAVCGPGDEAERGTAGAVSQAGPASGQLMRSAGGASVSARQCREWWRRRQLAQPLIAAPDRVFGVANGL